jgi:hypothetical protein
MSRSFTIETSTLNKMIMMNNPNYNGGRFMSDSPSAASKKALKSLFEQSGAETGLTVIFVLRETTQGSEKSLYPYVGTKQELDQPVDTGKNDANGNAVVAEYEYVTKPLSSM